MTQRLKEKIINVNPHQDATVNAMSAIILEVLTTSKNLKSIVAKEVALKLYVKGYRRAIK